MVTEPVEPLKPRLAGLTLGEVTLGLHAVMRALAFMHEHNLSHNNVHAAAVFCSITDGTWRLGLLDHARSAETVGPPGPQERTRGGGGGEERKEGGDKKNAAFQ